MAYPYEGTEADGTPSKEPQQQSTSHEPLEEKAHGEDDSAAIQELSGEVDDVVIDSTQETGEVFPAETQVDEDYSSGQKTARQSGIARSAEPSTISDIVVPTEEHPRSDTHLSGHSRIADTAGETSDSVSDSTQEARGDRTAHHAEEQAIDRAASNDHHQEEAEQNH